MTTNIRNPDILLHTWLRDTEAYEADGKELPLWAYDDPWMCRSFVLDVYRYGSPEKVSIGVEYGFAIKSEIEKGGLFVASSYKNYGHVSNILLIGNKVHNAYNWPNDFPPRFEMVEGHPDWFKWIVGQKSLF